MTIELVLLITGILTLGFFFQGYSGFGFAVVSMSFFAFVPYSIERLTVVISILSVVFVPIMVYLSRDMGKIQWRYALPLMAGVLVGIPLGYLFILQVGQKPIFKIFLGVILVVYAFLGSNVRIRGKRIPHWIGYPVGLIGGFIGGAFTIGGPPMVIYLYSVTEDPREMKGTLQIAFLTGMVVRLASIIIGPKGITNDVMILSLAAIPLMVPVLIIAHQLSKRHEPRIFRLVVNVLIGFFGAAAVVKGVTAIM